MSIAILYGKVVKKIKFPIRERGGVIPEYIGKQEAFIQFQTS
jgi:hypothetical protein